MNVSLYPYPRETDTNAYLKIIVENTQNETCTFVPFQNTVGEALRMKKEDVQVVFFNWYESLWSKSGFVSVRRFIKRLLILCILRLRKFKMVFAVHNKMPHEVPKHLFWVRFFLRFEYKGAEKIVVLCQDGKKVLAELFGKEKYERMIAQKVVKIPHPTYSGYYPAPRTDIRQELGIPEDAAVFLYLGAIRAYKNAEFVLRCGEKMTKRHDNVWFVLAGGGDGAGYMAQYDNPKMRIVAHFIPDEEVSQYMEAADFVMCPLNQKSSLNSSSCILALTYGKQLICPKIGTINELPFDMKYTYDYQGKDHETVFSEFVSKAYEDWSRGEIQMTEHEIREMMEKLYAPGVIGEQFRNLFAECEK